MRNFASQGGVLVVTYWSGVVDDYDSIYPGRTPYGLSDLLGLCRAEIDALQDGVENSVEPVLGNTLGINRSYTSSILSEIPEVYDAEPILIYGNDFYKGIPAVTRKGSVYYIGSMMNEDFYSDFFSSVASAEGLEPIMKTLPRGVFVSERIKDGKSYIFMQNFSAHDVVIRSETFEGKIIIGEGNTIRPYGTIVIER